MEYSSNCDEAIFRVQKVLLNIFWEYLPGLTNLVSDWLRTESSPLDEEEIKMDDVARYFTCFRGNVLYLLTCGRCSLVSGTHNDIVVFYAQSTGVVISGRYTSHIVYLIFNNVYVLKWVDVQF